MDTIIILNAAVIPKQATTASINSGTIDMAEVRNYMMQYVVTGSPVGTINVLISNDGISFEKFGSDIAISTATIGHIKDSAIGYRYIQVVFTYTSGTGTIAASVCGKQ